MNSHSLVINTLQASYLLDETIADAGMDTRRRLDRLAKEELSRSLEQRLAGFSPDNSPFIFIDELQVQFALNLEGTADHELSSAWARAIADSVHRAASLNGPGTVVYGSRAEFVAAFAEDLAAGRASRNWHFRNFDDLLDLPTAQALQRVLTEDPDVGRDALMHIARHRRLQHVLGILGDSGRATIVRACLLPNGPTVSSPEQATIWIDALITWINAGFKPDRMDRWSVLAELYFSVLDGNPQLGPDVNLTRFINTVIQLALETNVRDVVSALRREDYSSLPGRFKSSEARDFITLAVRSDNGPRAAMLLEAIADLTPTSVGPAWEIDSAASLRPVRTDRQSAEDDPVAFELVSDFAGIYLLIPAALSLKLYPFLDNLPLPMTPPNNIKALLLHIIALKCLGRKRWPRVAKEQRLHHFAGLDSPIDDRTDTAYEDQRIPGFADAATRLWEEHLSATVDPYTRSRLSTPSEDYSRWFADEPFGVSERHSELWSAMSPPSAMLLRTFVSGFGTLADSNLEYIARDFLESRAIVSFTDSRVHVRYIRCNLQVLLRMKGFEESTTTVPWLGGRILSFTFD
jgi:hypothetical protein